MSETTQENKIDKQEEKTENLEAKTAQVMENKASKIDLIKQK